MDDYASTQDTALSALHALATRLEETGSVLGKLSDRACTSVPQPKAEAASTNAMPSIPAQFNGFPGLYDRLNQHAIRLEQIAHRLNELA